MCFILRKGMTIEYRLVSSKDTFLFDKIAKDVFDSKISTNSLRFFLEDERHHITVAIHEELLVGFISAVDYFHPDKPRELWINEIGVSPAWQRRGIAKRLLSIMLDHGKTLGCTEAWVLTEPDNAAANALYRSVIEVAEIESTATIMHSFRLT